MEPYHHKFKDTFDKQSLSLQTSVIPGLREALFEPWTFLRVCFRLALLFCVVCLFYHVGELIDKAYSPNYVDITDFVDVRLPSSNITICFASYINESYVWERLQVPENLQTRLNKRNISLEEFKQKFVLFIIRSTRTPLVDQRLVKYFRSMYEAHQNVISDYGSFLKNASPPCHRALTNCQFNGIPFDCCAANTTKPMISDQGLCHQLVLNYDLNGFNDDRTRWQTVPGPSGGLQFDVEMFPEYIPWLQDDAPDGFQIIPQPVPTDSLGIPVAVPTGAHAFIELKAQRRVSYTNCVGRTDREFVEGVNGVSYDPYGFRCIGSKLQTLLIETLQCELPMAEYLPNTSTCCAPEVIDMAMKALYHGYDSEFTAKTSPFKVIKSKMEATIRELFSVSNRSHCRPLCDYWEYTAKSSFVNLASSVNFYVSRVSIFFGRMDYRRFQEAEDSTFYIAFCQLANVFGLYVGLSVASSAKLVVCFVMLTLYLAAWLQKSGKESTVFKTVHKFATRTSLRLHPLTKLRTFDNGQSD